MGKKGRKTEERYYSPRAYPVLPEASPSPALATLHAIEALGN